VTRREPVVDAQSRAAETKVVVPTPARDLRVATYNILGGKLGLDEVIAAIRSFDADLVALQEVDDRTRRSGRVDQPRVIAEALGMEVAFAEHRRFGGGRIGVVLLSKHPLANVERIALPGGLLAAVRADVTIAGRVVRTFVVHFHPTDPRDSEARQKGMDIARQREADAVLLLATRESIPTIVMGDFNARSNGPEYSAFADHFTDACPKGGATWPATVPLVRIDYVWSSPDVERLDCPRFTPQASDHRPVVADFRFALR
jgi:endonuclease/exonuclease/phosphatase family metal-dependent hydrolase